MSLLDTASLLLTPNAYKEGKLYSVIPSDGSGDFTFTRATTATRVNSDGLVELVPYNLLTQTNDLNGWGLLNSSRTTGQSNPFGSNDAIKLTYNTTSSAHYIFKSSPSTGQVTISIYAKANELNFLQIASAQNAEEYANFNLGSGVVGTKGTICSSSSIESVGDGWYRCAATLTNGTNSVYFCIVNSATSNWFASSGYAGANNTDGLFLWGAQLVQGSAALPYQKTETRLNIPRLDYSNGTCPSILLEPQRTNLLLQSSSFDNVYWTKLNSAITSNTTTAPDNTLTADTLTETATTNVHEVYRIPSPASIGTNTISVYVKNAIGSRFLNVSASTSATDYVSVRFSPSTQTLSSVVVSGAYSSASASFVTLLNGWYRVSLTFTASVLPVPQFALSTNGLNSSVGSFGVQSYTGDGTSGVYLWGGQLEAGSYATSYIPTTTASVTRNAEVLSKTGISSLIGQTEGTIFLDIIFKNPISSINRPISITETNWLSGGSIRLEVTSSQFVVDIVDASTGVGAITYLTQVLPNTRYKIAIAYKQNDCKLYVNGVDAGSDTTTSAMPTCSELYLNNLGGGFSGPYESNAFNAVALWKTRLTNDQLAQLTTI